MNPYKTLSAIGLLAAAAITLAARDLTVTALPGHDWWWEALEQPSFTLKVADTTGRAGVQTLRLVVATDDHRQLLSVAVPVATDANGRAQVSFAPAIAAPGFYRLEAYDGDGGGAPLMSLNFGYEPERIVSLPDAQPDLAQFWADALAELATVAPEYTLTEVPEKSGKHRRMYIASMRSLGGDTIRGFLLMPVAPGKHPARIIYNGYGAKLRDIDVDARPDWIEFLTYVRGQGLNEPTNKYGDWIVSGLDDKARYYYRGAFMDAVRFIDFIAQLPQADARNIFAEGGSQGGALTLVAAALDHRLRAIAPHIPFLSDYPDYFRIVRWPADPVERAARERAIAPADLFATLSYFDVKNLARWIQCPVVMGVGLQDHICPPHTNFSGYNLIRSEKSFVIYPHCKHSVDHADWGPRVQQFFESKMAK